MPSITKLAIEGTSFALVEVSTTSRRGRKRHWRVPDLRGFGTAIMHGGTTILAMISVTYRMSSGRTAILHLLLASFGGNGAATPDFNRLLVRPALATFATIVVLPLVIYLVNWQLAGARCAAERRDLVEGQLLELINGTFLDGTLKADTCNRCRRFQGEDLADMLCLLRLHGELALRAKNNAHENDVEEPPLDDETRDKLAELAHSKRAISETGHARPASPMINA